MSLVVDIEKRLGDFRLQVQWEAKNETLALLGPSGCGKSITLQCIAGIKKPDRGHIEVDGRTLFDSRRGVNLSPQQRRTGLLFQNYALFPHLTVYENLRCGTKRSPQGGRERIEAVMESLRLQSVARQYPNQLSGGQQQRVALGRLLVSQPDVLLLDEPFSALDSHLRFELEAELRQMIGRFGKTVVLVSHDRDEVFRLADTLIVMDGGCVEAFGSRESVFENPKTVAAARLTGCKNISPLKNLGEGRAFATAWGLTVQVSRPMENAAFLGIRMHDVRPGTGENSFELPVAEVVENPFSYTVMLRQEGYAPLGMELDKALWASLRGPKVQVTLPEEKLLLLQTSPAAHEKGAL